MKQLTVLNNDGTLAGTYPSISEAERQMGRSLAHMPRDGDVIRLPPVRMVSVYDADGKVVGSAPMALRKKPRCSHPRLGHPIGKSMPMRATNSVTGEFRDFTNPSEAARDLGISNSSAWLAAKAVSEGRPARCKAWVFSKIPTDTANP